MKINPMNKRNMITTVMENANLVYSFFFLALTAHQESHSKELMKHS